MLWCEEIQFTVDTIEDNVLSLNQLQQMLNTRIHLLPSYEIKQANEKIKQIENNIEKTRTDKQKTKKFTFSSMRRRKTEVTSSASTTAANIPDVNMQSEQQLAVPLKAKTFDNVKELLKITADSPQQIEADDDIVISNCSQTQIDIQRLVGAVYMKNLNHCTVTLGPVKSSVFVQHCNNCTFSFAARQIRIHSSEDCVFHIYAKSSPIIEHTTRVKFANYNNQYNGLDEHMAIAGFDLQSDMWMDVKDFGWLKPTPSPNWSLLQ